MLVEQQSLAGLPRKRTRSPSKTGLVALWCISAFVVLCLVLLSLIEGAAERKRLRKAPKATAPRTSQGIGRSIASDA